MKPIPYDKFTLISKKPPEQVRAEIISGLNEAAHHEFKRLDPISKRIISSTSGENDLDDFYIFTYEDRVLLVTPNYAMRMKSTEPRLEISFSRQGVDTKIELGVPFIILLAVAVLISVFLIANSIVESNIGTLFLALYMIVVPYFMIFGFFIIGDQQIKRLITDIAYNRI